MFIDVRILIAGLAITSFVGSGPAAEAMEDVAPSVVACTQIKTAAQLQAMQNHLANAYCLAKDIDLSGIANFVPIGALGAEFTGRLYGNNHVISNLTINNGPWNFVGLFGFIDGAVIQDLALVNAKVIGSQIAVGALVGRAGASSAPSTIERVSVTGQVNCANNLFCGGLAGFLEHNVTLTQASSSAEVSVGNGNSSVGGLTGRNEGTVQQSYATGPITAGGGNFVGGLIGYSNGGTVQQSYAAGPVTIVLSNSVVGGLVGLQDGGTVAESYAVAPVSAVPGTTLGGMIGAEQNTPAVSNAYWDTQTSGQMTSAGDLGTGLTTTQLRAKLQTGFGNAWAITKTLSYPFLNDPDIALASPLATLVRSDKVFIFQPVGQLDRAQYLADPVHADAASLATVYTIIARGVGIAHDVAQLKDVKIDRYFWDDAAQKTIWRGAVKTYATLEPLTPIASATTLNASNVIGQMNLQKLVILRGSYTTSGGGTATHYLLGTLYTKIGNSVQTVVAHDPWSGTQIEIDPASKTVVSPANFPLANFKVNGYRPVTIN